MAVKERKAKKPKVAVPFLKDEDVVFGTLVEDVTATIVAEQGLVVLKVEGDPQPFFLPPGLTLTHEAYGQQVNITVRGITHEVVLELGEDDIYEDELEANSKLMPVENIEEIKQLLEECKIRELTTETKAFSTCIAGIALSIVSAVLLRGGFQYPQLCYGGIPLGIVIALVFGIRPIKKLLRSMNTHIICDSANNYINVETGKTNMNGGMQFPMQRG